MTDDEYTVTKQGPAGWGELVGKTISFPWFSGFGDDALWYKGVLEGIQIEDEDPRYPRYYVVLKSEKVLFWDIDHVRVMVHD